MSYSSQPHGLQPTRLLCPWDFLGKSTGVACCCLPQIQYSKCFKALIYLILTHCYSKTQASTVHEPWISIVQARFRKGRGIRDQIVNIHLIIKKAREFQKNIYFCFIDYAKALDCVDHNKLWKIVQEMGIPEHLTCLLRNLYTGQEATVRTGHETTDWLQIRKGVHQGCILSPCLFNLYLDYIKQNARLDEVQAAIKIPRRNINNLRYTDETNLMAESEEQLKSLLLKLKEKSEKLLKIQHSEN